MRLASEEAVCNCSRRTSICARSASTSPPDSSSEEAFAANDAVTSLSFPCAVADSSCIAVRRSLKSAICSSYVLLSAFARSPTRFNSACNSMMRESSFAACFAASATSSNCPMRDFSAAISALADVRLVSRLVRSPSHSADFATHPAMAVSSTGILFETLPPCDTILARSPSQAFAFSVQPASCPSSTVRAAPHALSSAASFTSLASKALAFAVQSPSEVSSPGIRACMPAKSVFNFPKSPSRPENFVFH